MSMIRGDSEPIAVSCQTEDGGKHPFSDGDKVCLTVKLDYRDKEPVLQKIATTFQDGAALFYIAPDDTRKLPPVDYKYDVKLIAADGMEKTLIGPGRFRLEANITDG